MNFLARIRLAFEQRRQNREIRRHGWTGVYVGDYRSAPAWVYTIGFDETLDHPEIVIFDAPKDTANEICWRVFEQVRAGEPIVEGALAFPPDEGSRCVWRKVHPDQIGEWLTLARMRRMLRTGDPCLEAYQLVLSDSDERLPWEPGYDERLRPLQPALYLAPVDSEVAASGGV